MTSSSVSEGICSSGSFSLSFAFFRFLFFWLHHQLSYQDSFALTWPLYSNQFSDEQVFVYRQALWVLSWSFLQMSIVDLSNAKLEPIFFHDVVLASGQLGEKFHSNVGLQSQLVINVAFPDDGTTISSWISVKADEEDDSGTEESTFGVFIRARSSIILGVSHITPASVLFQ